MDLISEVTALREGIICPGDSMTINCSILSNSESFFLDWELTPPETFQTPVYRIRYDNDTLSVINVEMITLFGSLMFTRYIPPDDTGNTGYIESTIRIPFIGLDKNGITVNCATDLHNATGFAFFNTSCKFVKSAFPILYLWLQYPNIQLNL